MKIENASIVMCTRNRADMLGDALRSLAVQKTDAELTYDILVVDNGSTDETPDVVRAIADESDVEIRLVHESTPGQVYARNRGVVESHGDWIANFDDDQIATDTWLLELVRTARHTGAPCVGGALALHFPDGCDRELSLVCRRLLGESVGWDSVRPYTRKQGPGSGNQLLARSLFDELGLYDHSYELRGYDTDMYRRIRMAGHESWFTPHAKAYHVTPSSRLEERYFKETALHNGWSFSRRDTAEHGAVAGLAVAGARMVQAGLMHTPRLAAAHVSRDADRILTARCRMWRTEGYVRGAAYRAAPKLFTQRRFFDRYEFRAEQVRRPAPQLEEVTA